MEINIGSFVVESLTESNFFAEIEQAALAGLLDAECVITDEAKQNAKRTVVSSNNNSSSDDAEMSERVRDFLNEYDLKRCHLYYGDENSSDRTVVLVVQKEEMQLNVKAVISYTFDILTHLSIIECRGYDKEKAKKYIDDLADVLLARGQEIEEKITKDKDYDFDLLL